MTHVAAAIDLLRLEVVEKPSARQPWPRGGGGILLQPGGGPHFSGDAFVVCLRLVTIRPLLGEGRPLVGIGGNYGCGGCSRNQTPRLLLPRTNTVMIPRLGSAPSTARGSSHHLEVSWSLLFGSDGFARRDCRDGAPRVPGDLQDDEGDHEANDWIAFAEAKGHDDGACDDSERNESVYPCVIAICNERRACKTMTRS